MSLRRVPLARRQELARTAFPEPSRPWASVPLTGTGITRAREPRKSAATKNSGPTPKVRKLVLERDGYACACGCRRSIIGQRYSLGHRLRASQGGKAIPSNLLTFLGWGGEACHGRIDSRRDPRDEANGMTVRSGQDPALVPVQIAGEDGSRVTAWLWDDGQYHFGGPQEEAA